MTQILKGKPVADAIDEQLISLMPAYYEKGIAPTLAIIRVGENPSDIAYENGAVKKASKIGIQTEKFICSSDIEQDDLIAVIESVNNNRNIHGMLLLQPLPAHLDSEAVRNAIAPEKDLDCISDGALGNFFTGSEGAFSPCTAESCMEILKYYNIPIEGKKAVVIGRSMVIGKPVSLLLLSENATVTICHTRTSKKDLIDFCRQADLIVTAAGKAGTLTADMVKEGQTVIDVGINFTEDGKMSGDADFEEVSRIAGAVTPVPGGVGSVTTSLLMRHLLYAVSNDTE